MFRITFFFFFFFFGFFFFFFLAQSADFSSTNMHTNAELFPKILHPSINQKQEPLRLFLGRVCCMPLERDGQNSREGRDSIRDGRTGDECGWISMSE